MQERQQRAGQRAPEHDADQRDRDREGDQQPVLPVDVGRTPTTSVMRRNPIVPRIGAEREAGHELAPHDPPPVAQADFAERQRAYDQGRGLRA